jgi:hypothetical protein
MRHRTHLARRISRTDALAWIKLLTDPPVTDFRGADNRCRGRERWVG